MQKTKETFRQNPYLVTRVSLVDSIKNIPVGKSATFDCRVAGPISSARSFVSRYNKTKGFEAYRVSTDDNGITYTVYCNRK